MGIKEKKAAVRAEMSAFRIRPAERGAASAAICERLRAREEFCSAGTVLLYAPLPDELDVLPLMSDTKRFCFPRYQADRVYAAAWVERVEALVAGQFGILEPPDEATEIPASEVDLVVVPGLAFGKDCHRLGRGRGFYDRWLTELAGYKIGVGYDHQLIETVPREDHDVQLDGVATPSCWVHAS
ncbi:MAG: 5-formyltetrahydrofolate cyclo-ligase [Verrucomicrobiia bacterium]